MKKYLLILSILFLILPLISSEHIITFSSGKISYSSREDVSGFYNITIKNTDMELGSEIKQVNITVPDEIFIDLATLGSDTGKTYSIIGNIINWSSTEQIVGPGEKKNFWFNATFYIAGEYKLSVTTLRASKTFNFDLTANIECVTNWLCEDWDECINGEETRNCTDINECNSILGKPVETRACGCVPDWNCIPENWSECVDGQQERICVDFNNCGIDEGKPLEFQNCGCVPDWNCTKWIQEKCPESGAQERNCTDINECNSILGKPSEIKACTYKKGFGDFVTPAIIIILVLIAVVIILLIELWRKFYLKI